MPVPYHSKHSKSHMKLKRKNENYPRGKNKDRRDAGRGCDFADPPYAFDLY